MEGSGWRCRSLRFQLDGQLWMVNCEWWIVNCQLWMVNSRRCWSFDQQPKFAANLPVAKIILFQNFKEELVIITIHHCQSSSFKFTPFASTAGGLRNCNAAAFVSFWKFASPFSKFRRRRNRNKRGGLCNYWWKCEYRLGIIFSPLLVLLTNNRSLQ